MDRETLKALQAPLKSQYQSDPDSALGTLKVSGEVTFDRPGCRSVLLPNDGTNLIAGLHPMVGGDGSDACSGDLLLQALVTCAGTTLAAVSISMGLTIRRATLEATGVMDFRGTLGVDRTTPVGFTQMELVFRIDSDSDPATLDKLVELTERYCVVLQTLTKSVPVRSHRL
jgi:uncharacterized OsmC-like protein